MFEQQPWWDIGNQHLDSRQLQPINTVKPLRIYHLHTALGPVPLCRATETGQNSMSVPAGMLALLVDQWTKQPWKVTLSKSLHCTILAQSHTQAQKDSMGTPHWKWQENEHNPKLLWYPKDLSLISFLVLCPSHFTLRSQVTAMSNTVLTPVKTI